MLTHTPHTHTITILEVTKIEGPRESVKKDEIRGVYSYALYHILRDFIMGGSSMGL